MPGMYSKPGLRARLPQFRHDPVLSFPVSALPAPSPGVLLLSRPRGLIERREEIDMTPDLTAPVLAPAKRTLRDSVLFKMIVTGLLILALWIPLLMVKGTIRERSERRNSVVAEIG